MNRMSKVAVVLAALSAALGLMAATATAEPQEQVTICHVNAANPPKPGAHEGVVWYYGREITVSGNALEAHLAHGDVVAGTNVGDDFYITPENNESNPAGGKPWATWENVLTDNEGELWPIVNANCAFRFPSDS